MHFQTLSGSRTLTRTTIPSNGTRAHTSPTRNIMAPIDFAWAQIVTNLYITGRYGMVAK